MFENVKQEIDDKIKTNGNNEITATRLNGVLQDMMDASAEVIEEVQQSIGDQVEANPTEEPTDTLEKIKIGEGVFEIPQTDTSDLVTEQELQQTLNNYVQKTDPPSLAAGDLVAYDQNGDLGSSGKKVDDFATAEQGAKADTAVQPSATTGLLKNDGTVDTQTEGKAASALQPISGVQENNFASFDSNGGLQDSGFSDDSFIKGVKQNGVDLQKDEYGKVNVTVQDGEDGLSAFEIAQQQGYTGTVDQWLASLKANIGEFLFVPTDAAAVTAMATIGQTYSSAIDPQGKNVAPTQNTLSVILLMNDDATTPSKTMMIATQEVTPATTPTSYEFVYAGDLQSAMPSNVLTEDDIDNSFAGGSDKVASAEEAKSLNENKIDKVEIISETITYESVAMDGELEKGYIKSNGSYVSSTALGSVGKYSVTGGKTYKIAGRAASTSHGFYYFYEADNTPISGEVQQGTDINTTEVVAPATASYVRIAGYASDFTNNVYVKEKEVTVVTQNNQAIIDSVGDVSELDTTEKETVVGAINEVHTDAANAVSKVNGITETVISPNMFDKSTMLNGYVGSTDGRFYNGADYKTSDFIEILPNHYYYLSGRSSSKVIRCLDVNKINTNPLKVLSVVGDGTLSDSYYLPNNDATDSVVNGMFKTPSDAKYVQFTVVFSQGDSADAVMLTDVGESYNPDYVVPQYQPYDPTPKTFIKPSAIDCDDTPTEDSEKPITSGGVYDALQNIEPATTESKKLSVLLIGSSHGVNTISMFPALCKAAGIDITCGNLYTGSATIGRIGGIVSPSSQIPYKAKVDGSFGRFAVYENGSWNTKTTKTLQYALINYKWDVIIVQRGNTEVETWNDEMDGFFQYLLDYIKDNCIINNTPYTPRLYFNSGLANGNPYNYGSSTKTSQITTTSNIITTANIMKSRWGIDIIPTAVALQYARATCLLNVGAWSPNPAIYGQEGILPDLTYDGQHIDTGIGQYVLACCVFEKIVKDFFNMSVRELDYLPVYSDISGNTTNATESNFTPITEYYSRIGKTCAALACFDGSYNTDTATYLHNKFGAELEEFSITYNLTNCTLNDTRVTIMNDDVYMANFTSNSGYTLDTSTINVMMNSVDVTSNVYVHTTDNSINGIRIGEITGDIVITASAVQA